MKIYIAARFNQKQKVRNLRKLMIKKECEIIGDWTSHKQIKPYYKNQELAQQYSIEAIDAIRDSDVFIILSDKAGTGMYVELGTAILASI